jgi:hypothetical protein
MSEVDMRSFEGLALIRSTGRAGIRRGCECVRRGQPGARGGRGHGFEVGVRIRSGQACKVGAFEVLAGVR